MMAGYSRKGVVSYPRRHHGPTGGPCPKEQLMPALVDSQVGGGGGWGWEVVRWKALSVKAKQPYWGYICRKSRKLEESLLEVKRPGCDHKLPPTEG